MCIEQSVFIEQSVYGADCVHRLEFVSDFFADIQKTVGPSHCSYELHRTLHQNIHFIQISAFPSSFKHWSGSNSTVHSGYIQFHLIIEKQGTPAALMYTDRMNLFLDG